MAMISDRLRRTVQKLIIPTGDLGLSQGDVPPLAVLDDINVGLGLSVVQTPAGPRIQQANAAGASNWTPLQPWALLRSTTEGAGSTPIIPMLGYTNLAMMVEILALNGAPTNVQYKQAITPDGGVTWYDVTVTAVTTAGLTMVRFGSVGNVPATSQQLVGQLNWPMPVGDLVRLDWVFVGGTAPTVQHKIWIARY